MNAIPKLQPITVQPLQKPQYVRWDLVRTNDADAWVRANREALQAWYNDCNAYLEATEVPEPFDLFAACQFDLERARYEQYKADADRDDSPIASNGATRWED